MELKVGMRVKRKNHSCMGLQPGDTGIIIDKNALGCYLVRNDRTGEVSNGNQSENLEMVPLIIPESPTFELGDKVSWCGVEGVVEDTNFDKQFKIGVRFPNRSFIGFTHEGLQYGWHTEPSLILVEKWKPMSRSYETVFNKDKGIGFDEFAGKKVRISFEEIR